ncbi:ABC transporter substrate-binding protein [Arthrobacter sp. zg-Y1110]|uniref:ABC transporter substrate-binding protein n=1 Tax=Arthrobacter sp. zg-Y1110 TaxID=2886932 RepID=UPI001D15B173|nr:ABC transporter substrate-binding protein [Arthrobacter sp. zg-Y1110]MCC3289903.1 ABC transporter substrate-binding protein [Arthrobacter sp. zg-Y1110]UWX84689.1 ABC transporter substrate-binding protein [Arthrobacter sp. zg-Y1110]
MLETVTPSRRSMLKSMLVLPAIAAVPALASCANNAGSSDPGVLNVGQISDSIAFFPLFVAEQEGFFTAEGVTMGERPRLGTGAKVAAALKSGSIDLGAGVITDAFNLYKIDDDAKLVSGLVTEYYVDVVVGNNFDGPSADAPLEERIQALVGKQIGITGPGSGTEALMTYLFKKIGKNAQTDSTMVNIGSAATAAIGALTAGRVDALCFFQPIGQQVETAGEGSIYISPTRGDIETLRSPIHGAVFSTGAQIEAKQDLVDGFNRALDKSLALIQEDPEKARTLLGEYLKDTQPQTVDALVALLPKEIATSTKITEESYKVASAFHTESGLVDEAPDYAGFVLETSQA